MEFRSEVYEDNYDSLTETGQIVGGAGNSAGGGRNVKSAFGELLMPVLSNLEVSLAARYDEYSDYGNDTSPKLSVRWQPLDSLTLRASVGQGFRAPTLDIITAQPSFSADGIAHPATCVSQGQPAGCQTQVNAYVIANPNVSSEQSDQFSVGLAWDATDWLNMTVDYYDIEVNNAISVRPAFDIMDGCYNLDRNTTADPLAADCQLITRNTTVGNIEGATIFGVAQVNQNIGSVHVEGIDYGFQYLWDVGAMGQITIALDGTHGLDTSYTPSPGAGTVEMPGVPSVRRNSQ